MDRVTFIFVFLTAISGVAAANEQVTIGTERQVRTAPPHGPLNIFVGKKTGVLSPGTDVEVLDKKTYGGFSGAHVWYKVKPTNPIMGAVKEGWLYGGIEGNSSAVQMQKQ